MKDDFLKHIKEFEDFLRENIKGIPIPPKLHSAYLEGPFQTCLGCNENLLKPPRLYEIQKVFRGKEVIFEYAICEQCGENLMREYSKESMEAIQNYFSEHLPRPVEGDCCNICQSHQQEEYALMALCKGKNMICIFDLCHKCMEHLDSLLSQKTRETMQDFIDQKFPGIPAEFSPVSFMTIP